MMNQKIKDKAIELGFFACGISKAGFLPEDAKRIRKWLAKGFHADMAYMENHFEKRTDPVKLLEGAKSVITVLFNYFPKDIIPSEDNYKISKYAYGKDYHFVMKDKLKELLNFIEAETGETNSRAFVDSAPVLDRAWAAKSGLGWIGKNTNLITKKQGSFFFVGEIITALELDYSDMPIPKSCGHCTKCIEACPTHALRPYEVNANKCISYLTIENKGDTLPEDLKGKFEDWIFGCDICQDVCPWNRYSIANIEPGFQPNERLMNMRKTDWENLTEDEFKVIFKNSAVKRTKYKGLVRNIEFVKV
jgi:epoxyqueuosine reductase